MPRATLHSFEPTLNHPIEARNFLDRAVEFLSPSLAARRYAARASIDIARTIPASSYRGAIAGRSGQSFDSSTSFRGGSTKDRRDLASMRDRGRRTYRENVIGRSLLNTETDNVVAEGFSLQMRTKDSAFNNEAEDRFYRWLEGADVTGKASASEMFRMSWREPRKDGDGGFLLTQRGSYPYLQFIPGDLIRNPFSAVTNNRESYDWRNTFDGVQCDPSGRPVRFWIRDVDETGHDIATPIDAQDFVYLSHTSDALAVRGETVYGSIFALLDQLDTYTDQVVKAAIMACIFGLIEKRSKPGAVLNSLNTLANSEGNAQKAITLDKGGMLKVLGTEESIFQVQAQQPMTQTPDFIRAMLRLICLAFDMPLEIGNKDLSQVNFSGGRIGLIGYYRSCRVKQDWLKSRCWNRIVFWWLSKERQRQSLGYDDAFVTPFPSDYGEFLLHGREWEYNDPLTEAQADLLEISIGTQSVQGACEKKGRDREKIREDRRKQLEADRADGLPVVLSNVTRDEKQQVTAVDANGNPLSAPTSDPAAFKQDMLKQLLAVPAAREAVFNATDIGQLMAGAGVTAKANYTAPMIPVVASTGPLVSGALIHGPDGAIVGGDVENTTPDDQQNDTQGAPAAVAGPTQNGDVNANG